MLVFEQQSCNYTSTLLVYEELQFVSRPIYHIKHPSHSNFPALVYKTHLLNHLNIALRLSRLGGLSRGFVASTIIILLGSVSKVIFHFSIESLLSRLPST